jgi:hypothetical protein
MAFKVIKQLKGLYTAVIQELSVVKALSAIESNDR